MKTILLRLTESQYEELLGTVKARRDGPVRSISSEQFKDLAILANLITGGEVAAREAGVK